MAAQIILFDFIVDNKRTATAKGREEIAKLLCHEFKVYFPKLELAYQMTMDDGYFAVLSEKEENFVTMRMFPQGLVTINVEYYLEDGQEQILSFESSERLETNIARKLKSYSGQVLPIIKRGDVNKFFPTTDNIKIECTELKVEELKETEVDLNDQKLFANDIENEQKSEGEDCWSNDPLDEDDNDNNDDDNVPNDSIKVDHDSNQGDTDETPNLEVDTKVSGKRKLKRKLNFVIDKTCAVCNKNFRFQQDLVKHVKKKHTEPDAKPYKCCECSELFPSIKLLYRHRKIHKDLRIHLCEFCSYICDTKNSLQRHRRVHTNERPYVCTECGKAYKENADLKLHKRSHLTAPVPRPFACSVCEKTYRGRKELNNHMKTHLVRPGERPFVCSMCGKTFRLQKDLNIHQKTHSMVEASIFPYFLSN